MHRRSVRLFCAAAVVVASTCLWGIRAADWPRWLGPQQNGASPARDVFDDDPTLVVAWSRPLGTAYSGIAIASGKAVTMFGDGETDWLVALDGASGEEVWRWRIDAMFPVIDGADGGQLGTPVIDGGTVYGLGADGQLFAVRLDDGSKLWSVAVEQELGAKQPHFGFGTTPLVVGDLLVVQTGGPEGRSLTALDRKSGRKRWSVGDEPVGYQSPVVLELAGQAQIVAVTNASVAGLRPSDGTVLWRKEHGLGSRDGFSTPIPVGDDAFVLTGRHESAAFRVLRQGDGLVADQLWRGSTLKRNFAMPVLHDGHLYGFDADFLTCVEARTGKSLWKSRIDGAGLILVDGHLVLFAADGSVVVGRASPEGFSERARVKVSERAGLTYPSFADGGIFVRDLETIARVDVR